MDYDFPLEQKNLKNLPQFQGVNFHFLGGGKKFADSNPEALQALASEWEKHSLIQQRQGRGRRLVDVFLGQGDQAKQAKDYESAIDYYQQALKVDPNYSKAKHKLDVCRSSLAKEKSKAHDLDSTKTDPIDKPNHPSQSTPQDELATIRDEIDSKDFLDRADVNEDRKQILISIARRQGQTKFRQNLLKAYGYRCAITGFDAEEALEAAHIIPYVETENNDPGNGLLLRADLHTLFDLNLLAIHPDTMQIFICPALQYTEYRAIHEKQITVPTEAVLRPDPILLKQRLEQCSWRIQIKDMLWEN